MRETFAGARFAMIGFSESAVISGQLEIWEPCRACSLLSNRRTAKPARGLGNFVCVLTKHRLAAKRAIRRPYRSAPTVTA